MSLNGKFCRLKEGTLISTFLFILFVNIVKAQDIDPRKLRFYEICESRENSLEMNLTITAIKRYLGTKDCFQAASKLAKLKDLNLMRYFSSSIEPLRGLTNLESLSLSVALVKDFNALESLTGLNYLNLESLINCSTMPSLASLVNLETLKIGENKCSQIDFLIGLKKIKRIDSSSYYSSVKSLNALEGLTSLEEIKIRGYLIDDITPLKGLINLKSLSVVPNQINGKIPAIDIDPIMELKNLESLTFDKIKRGELKSIKINNFLKLKSLIFSSYSEFEEIEIQNSPLLEKLIILSKIGHKGALSKLIFVNAGENLKLLGVSDNRLQTIETDGMMKNLERISLDGNELNHINFLEGGNKLTDLDIRDNKVTDLSPLQDFTTLKTLHLSKNSIEDLRPLQKLQNINVFTVDKNKIIRDKTHCPVEINFPLKIREFCDKYLSNTR